MTKHNHMTRDIRPKGVCPKCDETTTIAQRCQHPYVTIFAWRGDGTKVGNCATCGERVELEWG